MAAMEEPSEAMEEPWEEVMAPPSEEAMAPLGGGYNSNPYALSYYNSRLGVGGGTGYPYYNTRFGAGGYPSSYYTSNYGNSVVGGGLGALGGVPPIGSGYNYGSGISGTVY